MGKKRHREKTLISQMAMQDETAQFIRYFHSSSQLCTRSGFVHI